MRLLPLLPGFDVRIYPISCNARTRGDGRLITLVHPWEAEAGRVTSADAARLRDMYAALPNEGPDRGT